jgi:hypothetical protein
MLSRPAGLTAPVTERAGRSLVFLLLASRAICCAYAGTVVAMNIIGYQRPRLAIAALLLALSASVASGALAWRDQAVPDTAGLLDTATAALVQIILMLAIRPADRIGSLNWALAYSVSCASWLALGKLRWWRALLACLLGAAYGVGALSERPGTAMSVTALVNAVSPPLYFGIAAAVFTVVLRIATELDGGLLTEQRQLGEAARLAERQRLFRHVHRRVLASLDVLALGALPATELRVRAQAEARALRRAFADPAGLPADGFQVLLADLITTRVRDGWMIHVVDDELHAAPATAAARALIAAIAELIAEITATGGTGQIHIHAWGDNDATSVIVRVTGTRQLAESGLDRARTCLAAVAGTVSRNPSLRGESRILLRAPA